MKRLRALGGVARLDRDPTVELAEVERQAVKGNGLTPAEARELLGEYEDGRWILAKLHCFAELVDDDGDEVERRDGVVLSGLWFRVRDEGASRRHAKEVLLQYLPDIADDLARDGQHHSVGELEQMPVVIEIERPLRSEAGFE